MQKLIFHRHLVEKLKSKCHGLDEERIVPNYKVRMVLAAFNIPYELQVSIIEELINFNLIKRVNKREVIIMPRCPKCNGTNVKKVSTGKKTMDYCYFCTDCEDQIAKEAIL